MSDLPLLPELRDVIRTYLDPLSRLRLRCVCRALHAEDTKPLPIPYGFDRVSARIARARDFKLFVDAWMQVHNHPIDQWARACPSLRPIYKTTNIAGGCMIKFDLRAGCPHEKGCHMGILSRPAEWRLFIYPCLECGMEKNRTFNAPTLTALWEEAKDVANLLFKEKVDDVPLIVQHCELY
jgi:hypothetical protein